MYKVSTTYINTQTMTNTHQTNQINLNKHFMTYKLDNLQVCRKQNFSIRLAKDYLKTRLIQYNTYECVNEWFI